MTATSGRSTTPAANPSDRRFTPLGERPRNVTANARISDGREKTHMRRFARSAWAAASLALLLALPVQAQSQRWVGAWASAQLAPNAQNSLAPEDYSNATLRQVVRLSIGGDRLRVKLSNLFGTQPLTITAARVAVSAAPDTARIDPATDRALTFAGATRVTLPAGGELWSDPIKLKVEPLAHLAISLHYPSAPSVQTGHPGSRATSYILTGDHTAAADLPGAKTADRWFQIASIDVQSEKASAIVAFGDSITDGYGVQPNTNLRWTDGLIERLKGKNIAVLNLGIGGNRVLADGLGPSGVSRFDRDVLSQSGVSHLIILEGVNDLGALNRDTAQDAPTNARMAQDLIAAFAGMVAKARARGIKAIGATILPYSGSAYYHPPAEAEAARQAVNAWIRAPGNFDAVIDWDAALRDPARPTHLLPAYDNDGLHPNMAGYKAMADAIPLSLFESR
ncbi:SGNH/GDSL hydrolase family protein [Caulobacter sp. SL161]|uniref:SGNH/GDSL hydrolase family protein n=1 Tax=Caulobacter sp. SL161 TaxID=2995156 RepID=UPI002274F749|nr:SGNH/GDSL hydrolase family protein [Caulobacter sp. SL161]MCY1648116.1 SGNH/GDSL hydrolase family protein [Caulobacter sp. SL161]